MVLWFLKVSSEFLRVLRFRFSAPAIDPLPRHHMHDTPRDKSLRFHLKSESQNSEDAHSTLWNPSGGGQRTAPQWCLTQKGCPLDPKKDAHLTPQKKCPLDPAPHIAGQV